MFKSSVCWSVLGVVVGCMVSGAAAQTGEVLGRYKVKSIDFEFVDGRSFKPSRLLKLLSFKKDGFVDAVLADFGREDIEEFYLKEGFAFAKVSFDRSKLAQGRVVYRIEEGPRVEVGKVSFSGNTVLSSGKLKDVIKTGKRRWVLWPGYYSEEQLLTDVDKLGDVYRDRGFLDCRVSASKEFSDDKRRVRITFEIDEGPRYLVKEVAIRGDEQIYARGGIDRQRLVEQVKTAAGRVYLRQVAEKDRRRLLKLYRELGFVEVKVTVAVERLFAQADGEVGPDEGLVRVVFEIEEGVQFRIGRVEITGNKHIQDRVIRRVLDEYEFQPGRVYNAEVARGDGTGELEERIRRTAYTEQATVKALPAAQPEQKDVEVHVKEGRTGMVMLGAGVGSDSGFIGQLMYDQRNFDISDWPESLGEFIRGESFRGGGQSLKVVLQPGTIVSQYLVSFNEPYFRDKPIALDVTGSSWERYRESYDEGRLKGFTGLSESFDRRYRGKWRRKIGFRLERVTVDDLDDDAPQEIRDVEGDTSLAGLSLGIGKDLVDNRYLPTRGWHVDLDYEQVVGEDTFGLLNGTYRHYWTVAEDLAERRTVLSTRIKAGTVAGDAPPFEKYYAGGMYTIRGFEYRGVSTRGLQTGVANPERKDPIGSDWLFLANAELTVPVVGESLSALFFVDSGTVDTGRYRVSVGGGIQLMIPHWFGPVPMQIGVGMPVRKDDEDEEETFFFSIKSLF